MREASQTTAAPEGPSGRYLLVSVHDVAPSTWHSCRRVLAAIREVADIPVTLLLIPYYRGDCPVSIASFVRRMSEQHMGGHELALHGYFHRDAGSPSGAIDWVRRRVLTAGEGEFSDLTEAEAAERLRLGQRWFEAHGWPLRGFVPPAWLLGPGSWAALRRSGAFDYVTTFGAVHDLRSGISVRAPCLTFSLRTPLRRMASRVWAQLALPGRREPVVRLALHPWDASDAALRVLWQRQLEKLLLDRRPVTKGEFVHLTTRSTDVRREAAPAGGTAKPAFALQPGAANLAQRTAADHLA